MPQVAESRLAHNLVPDKDRHTDEVTIMAMLDKSATAQHIQHLFTAFALSNTHK